MSVNDFPLSGGFMDWHSSYTGKRAGRILLLCCLLLILTACGGSAGLQPTTINSTGPATTPTSITNSGQQTCPASVKALARWDDIIDIQPGTSQIEQVTCANLEGGNAPQALITVRFNGPEKILDIYIYTNIAGQKPTQIFQLLNLAQGNAKISNYNTIITSEVDPNSSTNKGQSDANQQPDLDREFKWSVSAQTFVQVAFPGIYPHLTRYQAEEAQALVKQGQQAWELDARQVASNFASSLLKWSGANVTMSGGGGAQDVSATVMMQKSSGPGGAITLAMSRLEGQAGGIWEVTNASTSGMSITAPAAGEQLSSPFAATGTGNAFEGAIGQLTVMDHLYNTIGQVQVRGAQGMGQTTFNANASYNSTFSNGHEEGVLALIAISQADGSVSGVVMQKELL
jgi:hypothetical protein